MLTLLVNWIFFACELFDDKFVIFSLLSKEFRCFIVVGVGIAAVGAAATFPAGGGVGGAVASAVIQ